MKTSGFTLIEVLITVAIIGLLTSIGLPAYRDYLIRGKIPDATAGLAARQLQLEQTFQDNRSYAGSPGCTADTASSQYFNFACSAVAATSYTLAATGKGTMAGFTFTLDQDNLKKTVAVPAGWRLPSPNTCWVTKPGGAC